MFNSEEIKKVVLGLLGGSIHPVGDTSYDDDVKERVEDLKGVLEGLNEEMFELAQKGAASNLASVREVGEVAESYYRNIKEDINLLVL